MMGKGGSILPKKTSLKLFRDMVSTIPTLKKKKKVLNAFLSSYDPKQFLKPILL